MFPFLGGSAFKETTIFISWMNSHDASVLLCSAYPTILLFNHGVPTEYRGPRKADLLVRYLKKFSASDVSILDSDSAVNMFVEEAGTFFPIYIGFGLNSSVLEKFGIKYKKNAWFSVAKDFSEDLMVLHDFDKIPALVSLNPQYNERNTFYGPFEGKFIVYTVDNLGHHL